MSITPSMCTEEKDKIFIYLFFVFYIHKKHLFFFLNNICWVFAVGFWVFSDLHRFFHEMQDEDKFK
jgi:hypothetical protein